MHRTAAANVAPMSFTVHLRAVQCHVRALLPRPAPRLARRYPPCFGACQRRSDSMRHVRDSLIFTGAILLAAASGFAADQHVISPQQLSATVSGQVAQQDADRAAILEALARPEVRDAAKSLSIDIDRVTV